MKTRLLLTLTIALSVLFSSGCTIEETGNTLHAFTERMNRIDENYSLSENGYIYNKKEKTLTRFYKFNENEIMLRFTCDESNNLSKLDIAFPLDCAKSTQELRFIKDCITAYINNEEVYSEIIQTSDFDNTIKKVSYKTTQTDSGEIEMNIDVTTIGTVVTIMQNNL